MYVLEANEEAVAVRKALTCKSYFVFHTTGTLLMKAHLLLHNLHGSTAAGFFAFDSIVR